MTKFVKNKIGRDIPEELAGIGKLTPFNGRWGVMKEGERVPQKLRSVTNQNKKLLSSIDEAIDVSGLKDGMTISFHHHLRNGDAVLMKVVERIAAKGLKNINIISSSLTQAHDGLTKYIEDGTVGILHTSGIRAGLGKVVAENRMSKPIVVRSHGGRPRAILSGEVKIDVAFIGAPGCDIYGNINGVDGPSACGSLGYAFTDAEYAKTVVAITDNLSERPLRYISIQQTFVDYIVEVDSLGDPSKIQSGATRLTRDPVQLKIAEFAAKVIANLEYFKEGWSFQTGTGGASLATAYHVRQMMLERKIRGSFGLGGMTGYFCDMLEDDLFDVLYNVQGFDIPSIKSLKENPRHIEISADFYANPFNAGAIVNYLDVVILSALEIDTKFNVNVLTGSNGYPMGASGGHCDTAAGSKCTIVVAPSMRGRIPTIVDDVITVVTPGETIDILVTERGIAVNPLRKDLMDMLKNSGLQIKSIEQLKSEVEKITGKPEPIRFTDNVVGLVEYRDGSIIDVIKELEK